MRSESLDADSFHVRANGKEYIFRLYFVDAPETDMSFADRVSEQAKYFRLKPEQTITLGEHAEALHARRSSPAIHRAHLHAGRARAQQAGALLRFCRND